MRWALTVRSEIPSRRAICLFASPCRTRRQHLALARGELRGGRRRRTPRAEQLTGGSGVDRRLAPADRPDAPQHLVGVGVLEQIAQGAGVQRPDDPLGVGVRRQHEHVGQLLAHDLAGRRDPVELRHLQVHQDDVGAEPPGQVDGLSAVGRLADHVDVRLAGEQLLQAGPEHRVVVHDQHADGVGHRGSPATWTAIRTIVPTPSVDSTRTRPPPSSTRLCRPRSPYEPLRLRVRLVEADTVVGHQEPHLSVVATDLHGQLGGVGVTYGVTDRLLGDPPDQRDHMVGGSLDALYRHGRRDAGAGRGRGQVLQSGPQAGCVRAPAGGSRPATSAAGARSGAATRWTRRGRRADPAGASSRARLRTARTPCPRAPGRPRREGPGRSAAARPPTTRPHAASAAPGPARPGSAGA